MSKTNFSPRHHVITSIGDARARDVARLGWLFEEILIGIYGDFQNWNYGASKRKQTDLGKDNLRNFSEAPKQIEQEDFCALFTVMAAEDTKDQPTAALVAQYLRFGHFGCGYTVDWRGDEIVCNTCGDCCRRKEGQSAAG